MIPADTSNCSPNGCPGYSVLVSQESLCDFPFYVGCSDFPHRRFVELAQFPFETSGTPPLVNTIPGIVECSSEPQMIWANTGRIIAVMEDHNPFRNWSIGDVPDKSMGSPMAEMMGEFSVIVFIDAPSPQPTSAGLFNLSPENTLGIEPALLGTTTIRAARIFLEFLSTNRTFTQGHLKTFLLDVQRLVVRAINLTSFTPLFS